MKIGTKELALDAMLSAMCAVLGYLALDTGNLKVTFETLPILLGALLFGPLDGALIGTVGTGVYQLLRYGVSVTTLLWMLPYTLCGYLVGLYAKKHEFTLSGKQTAFVIAANELLITLLNTGVIYLDSRIYAYWFPGYISAALVVRFVICIGKAAAFSAVLPVLLRAVRKAIGMKGGSVK